jgi:hypothetical protein
MIEYSELLGIATSNRFNVLVSNENGCIWITGGISVRRNYSEKNQPQCPFVHHKYHTNCSRAEFKPLQ